jgi:hypothetical protein
LIQPFKLTVTYKKPFWGWLTWFVACAAGSFVVALRAAAAGENTFKAVWKWYPKPSAWGVMVAGAGAAVGVLISQYLAADRAFSGEPSDFLLLGVKLAGTFIATATAGTIAARGAAKVD